MAVARLSGRWILEVLRTAYPGGVLRRALLDAFAALLVSQRSSRGAKGRLARRLYARLAMLQRQGRIRQEDGIVVPLQGPAQAPRGEGPPPLGALLQKRLFLVMMAEDRPGGEGREARLQALRWDFLARAVEEGWTLPQAAAALGLSPAAAGGILARPPRAQP